MDVATIRREHLRRLILREGSARAFAEKVGTDPNYLSTIVSATPQRNAGTRLMRRVERAYGLESGTLDLPDQQAIVTALAIQALPDTDQQQVMDYLCYKLEHAGMVREEVAEYIARLRGRTRGAKPLPHKKSS